MTLDDQKRLVSLWMQFLDGNEIAFSQLASQRASR